MNSLSKLKKMKFISWLVLTVIISSCSDNKDMYDAAGYFEVDEVMVSANQNGNLLSFNAEEGQTLKINDTVGQIDVTSQKIQKEQVIASLKSLNKKTVSSTKQVTVAQQQLTTQQIELDYLNNELKRTENLVKADAVPTKKLDDLQLKISKLPSQMKVTREQIKLYKNNASTQNNQILSQRDPLQKSVKLVQYQINQGTIINPISGIVLSKYANVGELVTIGRPLYKIANLDNIYLKAYVTGNQLPNITLQQEVTVRIDNGSGGYFNYLGRVVWIASQSEFTPKTIHTKKERANLVYAVKVKVKNDGRLKLGMYGELIFNHHNQSK